MKRYDVKPKFTYRIETRVYDQVRSSSWGNTEDVDECDVDMDDFDKYTDKEIFEDWVYNLKDYLYKEIKQSLPNIENESDENEYKRVWNNTTDYQIEESGEITFYTEVLERTISICLEDTHTVVYEETFKEW
jgi:hypothetical protein